MNAKESEKVLRDALFDKLFDSVGCGGQIVILIITVLVFALLISLFVTDCNESNKISEAKLRNLEWKQEQKRTQERADKLGIEPERLRILEKAVKPYLKE
ncbi:hypothetical protein SDC9_178283 [bioreactor metagenome]|uniref:Uncharacterized protein n=1 Tax=bioreactor metagenome TaxID=1076179 RepID=A0A645GXP7_9ZZZZ